MENRRAGGLLDEQPGIVLLIVAFLAWLIVTSVSAISPGAVFGATGRYALNAVLFLIACGVLRKRRDVVWVLGAFRAGAAISAAWGIVVPPASTGDTGLARVSGTIGDPNESAAVLVAALPLAVALAAGREWPSALRGLGAVTAGLSVAGIVLSVSRGAFVALIVVLVAAFVLAGRWRPKLLLVAPLVVLATGGISAREFRSASAHYDERRRDWPHRPMDRRPAYGRGSACAGGRRREVRERLDPVPPPAGSAEAQRSDR